MANGTCKLTVCFEDPFWIGLVETVGPEGYRVARHVFGPEPTDPQIALFIHNHWNELRFTSELQVEKRGGTKINPKRMRRIIEAELAANARRGTKAQQALSEQREANKVERRVQSREQQELEKQQRYEKDRQKRKEKHRGH